MIVNDFVGPTKMQWSRRQLEIVNGVLAILPQAYRKQLDDGRIKKIHYSPSRLGMRINDPSEAVESGNIMPLLQEMFEVIEIREYGGTILHLLFENIAHNFLRTDPETNKLLQLCFDIEDVLLELNDIPSDFVLAVCRKPGWESST